MVTNTDWRVKMFFQNIARISKVLTGLSVGAMAPRFRQRECKCSSRRRDPVPSELQSHEADEEHRQ